MEDDTTKFAGSPWTWRITFSSAVLALASHLVGGVSTEFLTGVLTAVALSGAVLILYRHGQRRESPSGVGNDDESRREKEMKAEAGGFGGNSGL
ncbi:hypothetical protein [Halogeometricum borinquense]|uniref:hypothetical protein n=1 Tax=Halogeometricum borinquense TaxID=60847 RepID=UPI001EF8292A|nr:hypothetical protein [Halogeometricum borinquense]